MPTEESPRQHESDSNTLRLSTFPIDQERAKVTKRQQYLQCSSSPRKQRRQPSGRRFQTSRRFTRVRAACDRCRIKKTKCDGTRPCLRCRHDDVICVDNRRGEREPKMVSAEYVTMLEAQQEQLIKTLRKLHSQQSQSLDPSTTINTPGSKQPGPTIQEILGNFPGALADMPDELPHKKARKSASSSLSPEAQNPQLSRGQSGEQGETQADIKSEMEIYNSTKSLMNNDNSMLSNSNKNRVATNNNIITNLGDGIDIPFPRASTFPTISSVPDSDLLNSLDVGENMGMQLGGDDLPERDPSVWDGLGLDLYDRWTNAPDMNGMVDVQGMSKLPDGGDAWGQNGFCDPRALAMPEWQDVNGGVNINSRFGGSYDSM